MELVKNIFFNTDRLTSNSTLKISYTGNLFQAGSKEVSIEYCFNDNWDEKIIKEMTISELGYQVEIDIPNVDTFSFYFKNENDEFDSNDSKNYIFEIEHPELSLTVIDNNKISNHLRKTYIWSKKIKLAIYKLLISIPKLLTGNYKKKIEDNDNI